MDLWILAAIANGVLFLGYTWLAIDIGIGLQRGKQWRSNPVGVATMAIFATCAIGHGIHAEHTILPMLFSWAAGDMATLDAARSASSVPLVWAWHGATAIVVVAYLLQRQRLRLLSRGSALCEDMVLKQARAANLQERVGEVVRDARRLLEEGNSGAAMERMDEALEEAREIATDLVVGGRPVRPGRLRIRAGSDAK